MTTWLIYRTNPDLKIQNAQLYCFMEKSFAQNLECRMHDFGSAVKGLSLIGLN